MISICINIRQTEYTLLNILNNLYHIRHGPRRRCFTNIRRVDREGYQRGLLMLIVLTIPSNNNGCDQHCVVFADKCLFCDKETIKVKGVLDKVTKCVTKYAEDFIILTVARRFDLGSFRLGS